MLELESKRLHIRTITEADLSSVFTILSCDPAFLALREGSQGLPGHFELEAWQRDWHIAQLMPGRHTLACILKSTHEPIGYIDYLEEFEDGYPRLGALIIHISYRGKGLGRETFNALARYFREVLGWNRLRASIEAVNKPGIAFALHLGFQPLREVTLRLAAGEQKVILLEKILEA